jgi:hypothetical protein
MLINRWWTRPVPSGTTDVMRLSDLAAQAKLADYGTKSFWDDQAVAPREWIIYPPPTSSTKRFSSPVQARIYLLDSCSNPDGQPPAE